MKACQASVRQQRRSYAEVVAKRRPSPPQPKPQVRIPTTISELQDLQDNEQLHRLVQLIVETVLTGKLGSLGFTLGTPVTSQTPQKTQLLPLYSLHIVPVLVRIWSCPQKQVPRGQSKVTWRKGPVLKAVAGSSNQITLLSTSQRARVTLMLFKNKRKRLKLLCPGRWRLANKALILNRPH